MIFHIPYRNHNINSYLQISYKLIIHVTLMRDYVIFTIIFQIMPKYLAEKVACHINSSSSEIVQYTSRVNRWFGKT